MLRTGCTVDTTPASYIYYDESSVTVNGTNYPLINTKGRISHTTAAGATAWSFYNYDPVGRVQDYSQCTLSNCTGVFLDTHYNYDLGGDVANWNHPNGFTLTNTFNDAQQITQITSSLSDSTHPQTLATLTYTPFGAINTLVNGCVGTGCTQRQETYDYNNRLQPVRIQLGTSSNHAQNYCLVYNYYSGSNPTSCAVPSQGSSNNGNVMGYWYQDSITPSLSHSASYTYDPLNRLATAAATGSSTYSMTFSSDRYGNTACTSMTPPCGNYTFNLYNQIATSGYTYDAAGNLTGDGTHSYQWDAENHLKSVDNGTNGTFTYNAYGWRVYNSSGSLSYLLDPSGQFLGGAWTGGSISSVSLGSRLMTQYLSDGAHFSHANVLGSETQTTDWAGNDGQAILHYPWGQVWSNSGGNSLLQEFASLQLPSSP